jgi:hypothetical protein
MCLYYACNVSSWEFNFIDPGRCIQNSDIASGREDLELRRCLQIILSFLSGLFLSVLVVYLP